MGLRERIYHDLNKLTNGILGVIVLAVRRYLRASASEAAASLAYYAFFSTFPLLLVLISLGSFALESDAIAEQIFGLLSEIIPGSAAFIETSIQQVLDQRGPVGIVGLLGLVWSASGAFSGLVKHINLAWPGADRRGMFHRRFVGVGLVVILSLLFAAWIASNLLLDVLPHVLILGTLPGRWIGGTLSPILSNVVPFFFTFSIFFGLYWQVPNREVPWRVAIWGAVVAAAGSEIVTNLFSWYITSGFAGYSLVYGSLGAIVAFMFWIYLLSQITLFGAHLSAAVGYVIHRRGG